MNIEQAYRKTLIKWQRLAAGEWTDPAEDCGICDWAEARRKPHHLKCNDCPAYHHYGYHPCAVIPCMINAMWAHDRGDKSGFQRRAQLVVEELLSIKDSLFGWAKKLDTLQNLDILI